MLNIITTTKHKYSTLSETDKQKLNTIYLIEDVTTGLCSIYARGKCYGEDIDEESIDARISKIQNDLASIRIASNSDILDILNS